MQCIVLILVDLNFIYNVTPFMGAIFGLIDFNASHARVDVGF